MQSGTHRVEVRGAAASQMISRGGKLIADYGSYALVEAGGAALSGMPEGSFTIRDEYRNLLLNAGTIDTLAPESATLRATTLPASGRQFHLVQFAGPVKNEWHDQLRATGVQVVAYIPHNAYLVYGDAAALSQLIAFGKSASHVQWDGPYLDDYKVNPRLYVGQPDGYQVQLIEDAQANAETMARAAALEQQGRLIDQRALGYVNLVLHADRGSALSLARQPDVVSIIPFYMPKKLDERANQIAAGRITGNGPTPGDYMTFLTGRGFTQAQFDASGLGVDVTDSGLDNATLLPNHYGLYVGGNVLGISRVNYARLEGTPNGGSTIQGCDGHGTLNCHIIGGFSTQLGGPHSDAQGFRYNLGIAPFVRLGSSVIFDPNSFTFPDYEDMMSRAYRDNMRISSNSWGAAVGGAYNTDSQRYDALVRDAQPSGSAVPNPGNQEMVIVFAAGNSGPGTNTVGSPGTAKNIITAGAAEGVQAFGAPDQCGIGDADADSANDIVWFSSRGPCDDGRIKPDLVAAGSHVSGGVSQAAGQRANPPANPLGSALGCFDASGVCAGPTNFWPGGQQWTTASSGTSHSTPLIAGAAALVRQRHFNIEGVNPSAAMVKAKLINGARYMTGSAANDNLYSNNQGMGYLDIGMSLDDTARFMRDQVPADLFTATGQSRTFNTFAGDPTKPFRVTLVWTDAPGATAGNSFNNNLDLTVTVGGNTYRGNVFTGRNSSTGGTADIRNNVESVFLAPGVTGPATVTVTATNIVSDGVPGNASPLDQDFALIAYNTCPNPAPPVPQNPAASVPGNNQIQITWDPSAGATSYKILRSVVSGGPYTDVGTVAAPTTTFTDGTVSGGTTYFYVVRASDCADSADSAEVSALATGDCTQPPTFAGLATATGGTTATCGINLAWAAGTPFCGGTLTYNVYRSRTPGFTPSIATRIATVAGTAYADAANVQPFTTYYYVVRAVETSPTATNEETNTVQRNAQATGAVTQVINYFDDLDANRPPSAASYWIPSATTINTTNGCRFQSTSRAWRFGQTVANCGGTYPTNREDRLVLGGNGGGGINGFAIPANTPTETTSATLSFSHAWRFEIDFDGAFLEYSTQGSGGPWTAVPGSATAGSPYIVSGSYNGLATLSRPVWQGEGAYPANGSFNQTVVNVDALAGQTVWFAWHYVSDVSIVFEGHYLDDVRFLVNTIGACSAGGTPPGPAVSFDVRLPATSQAGVAELADLTALDAVEQIATGYNGTANLTSSDPQATIPPTAAFTAGLATANVTFGTLGIQTLTATDGPITGTGGTDVTPGVPARLQFGVQPSDSVAGVDIAPAITVRVTDAFGNLVPTATDSITVAIGSNPSGGILNGTTTVNAVAGIATFSDLDIQQAGTGYTLVATSATLAGDTSAAFTITSDAPAAMQFSQQPSDSAAGTPFAPSVAVLIVDQYGNPVSASLPVMMMIANNPSGGSLLGTTVQTTVAGVAVFADISIDKVGTGYTLRAISGPLTPALSSAFNITPAAPHHLVITQQPGNAVAGQLVSPVGVAVHDRFGNLATQSSAPLSATLRGGTAGAVLSGTTTVNATAGVATFSNLSVDRAGLAYVLDFNSVALQGTSTVGFDVAPGAPQPVALQFGVQPSNGTAGAALSPAVTVRVVDSSGNTVTSATNSVTLAIASNPSGGTLSGTVTAAAVNGVATFATLSIDRSGNGYTLSAAASGLTGATSSAFNVSAAAAASLAFTTQPSNSTAGLPISPAVTVAARDAFGNLATSFNGAVALALSGGDPAAVLSGSTATAVNGVATFAASSVDRTGTGYLLTATSGALAAATSNAFNVSAGAAAQLVFTTQPSNTTAGQPISPAVAVEVRDGLGNVATSYNGLVLLSLTGGSPGATLSGGVGFAINGVATFSGASVDRSGAGYQLIASSGALSATSNGFNVSTGAAAQLAFGTQPSNSSAGQAISPAVTVEVRDSLGNLVTSFSGQISLALSGGAAGATLSGGVAFAVNGVAAFPGASVNLAGTGYQLTASAGSLPAATSGAFDVSAGAAARLVFTSQPTNTRSGQPITPAVVVEARDAFGNAATSFTGSVTLALQGGNPNAALSGTTTATAAAGVATFSDLSVDKSGRSYTLSASASGLTGATSNAFNIGNASRDHYVLSGLSQSVTATVQSSFTVQAYDSEGNLAEDYSGTASVASNDGAAALPGNITFTNGVAANVPITFRTTGVHSVTVTDTSDSTLTITGTLVVTGFPQPVTRITAPANGSSVTGEVTITAEGSVATGTTLTRLEILVDGASVANGTTSPLNGVWDASQLTEDSTHVITSVVTDAAGNVVTSSAVTVIIGKQGGGCGCSTGTGGGDVALLAAVGAALRAFGLRRRRQSR